MENDQEKPTNSSQDDLQTPFGAPTPDDEANVDLAIAALGSLATLTEETERTADGDDAEEALAPALEAEVAPELASAPALLLPPLSALERGQSGSVVPALALMGVGAFLTFMLTTSDTPPDPLALLTLGIALVGITLLSYWVSSGRWSAGNFFFGTFCLLCAAVFMLTTQLGLLALPQAYPLFLSALGLAVAFTGWLTPLTGKRLSALGITLALGGLVGTLWLVAGIR
jgi:hypothetical protein